MDNPCPKLATVSERVYLTFPRDLIKEPVLSMLSKQFDVVFNIRASTVTAEWGLWRWKSTAKTAKSPKPSPG